MRACPACGSDQSDEANFCARCGTRLDSTPGATGAAADPLGADGEAERRQLTVLFCDVADSTSLSERLDPEDLREVLLVYQQRCVEAVQAVDGYIAQYLGDGVLVYFGYPQAHEDDARRAVRAGLGICAAIGELNERLQAEHGVRLALRVGIHTGDVVTGEVGGHGRSERLATGLTPNIAARLQSLADPGSVVVSESTRRLAEGHFSFAALGRHSLKGVREPMPVYRVEAEAREGEHLRASREGAFAPLVGREREIGTLVSAFEQVRAGSGRAVLVAGEAGIGKSRIVYEFLRRLRGARVLRCRGDALSQSSAFQPVIELLCGLCGIGAGDSESERLGKLEAFTVRAGLALWPTVPLLAPLAAIPLGDRYEPLQWSRDKVREQTLSSLRHLLSRLSLDGPLVLVVEDLHWIDHSTLELIGALLGGIEEATLLLVLTGREEFTPPWETSHLARVDVKRLSLEEAGVLAEAVAGKPLPPSLVGRILERTEGVPIFVEELTRAILESGLVRDAGVRFEPAASDIGSAIPSTLQSSLMARLDRLGPAKRVAQLAATIGREFDRELLATVTDLGSSELGAHLGTLIDAHLVREGESDGERSYAFRHALIHEAAYRSLLRRTRRECHHRIAESLVTRPRAAVEVRPEIVAHHYTEAKVVDKAVEYWGLAGKRALERCANLETIAHLNRGLTLLEEVASSPARDGQELELQTTLALAQMASKGYGSPEVGEAYQRAHQLCQRAEERSSLPFLLWGRFSYHLVRSELDRAIALGEELLALAESLGDESIELWARVALGTACHYQGRFEVAQDHLDRALELDPPERDRSAMFLTGQDIGVVGRIFLAQNLWFLGRPETAKRRAQETVALARQLGHPFSLAFAVAFSITLNCWRGDHQTVAALCDDLLGMAEEYGFGHWLVLGTALKGWAMVQEGTDRSKGLATLREGFQGYLASGGVNGQLFLYSIVAGAALHCGELDAASRDLKAALAAIEATGEAHFAAEIHRLVAECLLSREGERAAAEADRHLMRGLELARAQGAQSLALRLAISCCRRWRGGERSEWSQERLAEVLASFSEGHEEASLREARALLAQEARS